MNAMGDSTAPFARVFMHGHSQYRFLLLRLAALLKERYGSEIFLFCSTSQEKKFWEGRNSGGLFHQVIVNNTLYETVRQSSEPQAADIDRLRTLENELGVTVGELAMSDRHLGRGFSLAGFKHPRSRMSEGTSYGQVLNGYLALIEFWKSLFDTEKPTLVINCGKLTAVLCRNTGVPYRTLVGSRYKNFHMWAHNEFFENPEIAERFSQASADTDNELAAPYDAHMALRVDFNRQSRLISILKRTAYMIAQNAYWRMRGYEKAKGYFLSENIKYIWRRRSHSKKLQSISTPLSSLEGKTVVYYPLHTEPEIALQALSPEYFYQHACIAALARDLPAGVVLAVKETYEAVGRRPSEFYNQLLEFKNVVMLDMLELGLEVVRKADAVVTITGTGGFEGAVLGKPVVTFGRHNSYAMLGHVRTITDETVLKASLRDLLGDAFEHDKAKQDGRRFLQAVVESSFDLENYDYRHVENVAEKAVESTLRALERSLAMLPCQSGA